MSAARRGPVAAAERDHLVLKIYTWDLVLAVATQKVAIPLSGREAQITAAMCIHFGCIAFLLNREAVFIARPRLILLAAFASLVVALQIPHALGTFSPPSLLLMLMTAAMLVFVAPIGVETYHLMLRRFVLVAVGAAALVGVDWAVQALGHPMPDLETIIPHAFVYYEYNYIQPVHWGSPWMKPNGVFFLETSHVSQFIAMGLVIEIALFRRLWVVAALGAALASTLGVTGILLAALSVPFLLARMRITMAAATLSVAIALSLMAAQSNLLDGMLRRSSEFSQNSSSGYNRFVLPVEWSVAALQGPTDVAWLGSGAGTMPKAVNDDAQGIAGYAWPPYTKVGVEYGAIALLAWSLLLACSLISPGVPLVVSWVAFFQYNFLNGSLNVPIHTIYCVLLCAGYVVRSDDAQIVRAGFSKAH